MNACTMTIFGFSLLVGCAPINTNFSCNATAGDRCLSIEEVDAMTQPTSTTTKPHRLSSHRWDPAEMKADNRSSQLNMASKTQTIWIAPWRDEMGRLHQNDALFANVSRVPIVG